MPGTGDVSDDVMTATGNSLVWTYPWTVTNGGDGTATITISAEDLAGNNNPTESNNDVIEIDNTAPTVSSYTFDGVAADAFFNPGTISLEVTATEPVDWVSLQFQKVGAPSIYKTYPVDPSYDGTDTATQVWDGTLSAGSQADVAYEVKVHVKDAAGNETTTVLTPYTVTVDTLDPTITGPTSPTDMVYHLTDPSLNFTPDGTGTNPTCEYTLDAGASTPVSCTSATPVSVTLSGLTDGRHSVVVTVTDQAGNTDSSAPISFVYDTDGILTVDDTPANNPDFATIQGAIDAWVPGINTIDVAAGTYNENVTVDQALSILGPNKEIDPNTGSRGAEATISAPSTGSVVTIASDGVTIDGLTITNGNHAGVGIYSADHNNLTIANDIITAIGNNADDVAGRGIEAISSSADVDGISITNNKIDDITSGLRTGSSSTSASGISIGWSTGSDDITNLLIQDNVISDINADTSPWGATKGQGAYGILINHGTAGGQTQDAQVIGNKINNLEGLWAHGIGLEGDTPNATITGNTIDNLIDHKGGTDAVAIFFESNPSIAGITVSDNNMSNSALGVALHPDLAATGAGVLDASENWWGNATGPYSATSNPAGLGVAVWPSKDDSQPSYVKFSPFYQDAGMTTLVSADPIDHFVLAFTPNPQTVGQNATLTATAKDASGYTVVNDTTTKVQLAGDNGASFGATLLTMQADGDTNTTVTNTIAGAVNVTATELGGTAYGTGVVTFNATDTIAPIVNSFTVSGITKTTATLNVTTNENATCAYSTNDEAYASMTAMSTTGVTSHSQSLTGLTAGTPYTYYVRCADVVPNTMTTSASASFTTSAASDTTPPVITLLGQNPLVLTVGDTFTDPGATANDNVDGDITSNIVINNSSVDTSTAGTYTVTYDVHDTAGNNAVQETRTVIVVDPVVTPITPTVTLKGDPIVSSYTQTEATTRFASGLQFDTTNAASVTVNGSSVTPASTITAATQAQAITVGAHTYNVIVTSSTGDTANITVSYLVTADPTPDTTAPSVVSANPASGAVGVSITAGNATIEYDENIAIANQAGITIMKVSDSSSVKSGVATVAGDTLTIPYNALEYGTAYKITISTGAVTDTATTPNNAPQTDIYFTTQAVNAPGITLFNVSNVMADSATINWATDVTVDSAKYRYSTDLYGGTWTAMTAGASGSQALSGLSANTTYYYQVRFVKDGVGTTSQIAQFTTTSSNTGLSIDSIQAIKSYATADDTYANGWKWKFNVTLNNLTETKLAMKFDQWISGTNTLDAANNMRYSVDDATWTSITANGTYPATDIDVSAIDNDASRGGRQVTVYVEMKVPAATAGGSYSASYGIKTESPIPPSSA